MRAPLRLLAALSLLAAAPAAASDLADLTAALRQDCAKHQDTRCASPRLDRIKHLLRDRVEAALKRAPADLDPAQLERMLGITLPRGKEDRGCAPDDDNTEVGTLGLTLRRNGTDLELRTSVGIACGADESAYLYRWEGGGWRRYWQSEQAYAKGGRYRPRHLTSVQVVPETGLVVATGVEEWCDSAWHQAYYQIWRAAPGQGLRLLLDGSDFAYLGELTGPLTARLGEGDDVYVEYMVASVAPALHSRPTLRHYRIEGDRVRRVDPVALTPVNFVEEWLSAGWPQSAAWTEPAARESARRWHAATRDRRTGGVLTAEVPAGQDGARRCRADGSLWQVALDFPEAGKSRRQAWFLVRKTDPYRFRLAAIAGRPWPDCTASDGHDDRLRLLMIPQY